MKNKSNLVNKKESLATQKKIIIPLDGDVKAELVFIGEVNKDPYLLMENGDLISLEEYLASSGKLSREDVLIHKVLSVISSAYYTEAC